MADPAAGRAWPNRASLARMIACDALRIERPAPGVARIVIDRPPANALSQGLRAALRTELARIDADHAVRAVILTGAGRAFCSGDDLSEAQSRTPDEARNSLEDFAALFSQVERLRPPVVAAVGGWCTGGGLELALCCDLRIASDQARFVCAGVNVGLVASAWRLPRLIGLSRAKQMLLTGLPVDATTAAASGMVSAVVAADALQDEALKLAERVASRAPLAVEAAKRIANQAFEMDGDAARDLFVQEASALALTQDHSAALEAFAAKAEPKFTRR